MPDAIHASRDEHEPSAVAIRPVLWTALGFLIFVVVCIWAVYIYYASFVGTRSAPTPRSFPAPQLQRSPLSDLEKLQQKQRAQLQGYAWVDQSNGLVHIPIERAMQIVAARGLKAYDPLSPPPTGGKP